MDNQNNRMLIIAAHPDDEVIGMGGTVVKVASKGFKVYAVIVSDGTEGTAELIPESELATIRRDEALRAHEILGINTTYFLGIEDMSVQVNKANMKLLIQKIRSVRPLAIFTHHMGDLHWDHLATASLARDATMVSASSFFKDLGEPWRTSYFFVFDSLRVPLASPTHLIAIDTTLDAKLNALNQYKSQIKAIATFIPIVEGLSTYRGSLIGVGAAEAFQRIDLFPAMDLDFL